jgi:hypothetical protein
LLCPLVFEVVFSSNISTVVDMIYTFNVGAFKYITFFVVCMQLEYQVTKRSGYIINRISVGEQTRNLITFPPVEYLKIQGT